MLTKDLAICIRAVDYSETSQILTLFTRQAGKISAIAKGSKRPKSAFDGPIEVFSHGKIVFSDSNKEKLATLTEFEQQPGFTNLAGNLFTLNCCFFATELVNNLTNDYDPHPELFDSFLRFLQDANKIRDTISLLILFQLSLLKEIGLRPILNACVNCKTSHESLTTSHGFYFSSSANGLICRDCEASFPDKIRLTKTTANCLANVKLLADVNKKTLNEVEKILIYHFTEILGRPPKMAKYILKK
jgi:DNA repair protein RecO (recombination protein O)